MGAEAPWSGGRGGRRRPAPCPPGGLPEPVGAGPGTRARAFPRIACAERNPICYPSGSPGKAGQEGALRAHAVGNRARHPADRGGRRGRGGRGRADGNTDRPGGLHAPRPRGRRPHLAGRDVPRGRHRGRRPARAGHHRPRPPEAVAFLQARGNDGGGRRPVGRRRPGGDRAGRPRGRSGGAEAARRDLLARRGRQGRPHDLRLPGRRHAGRLAPPQGRAGAGLGFRARRASWRPAPRGGRVAELGGGRRPRRLAVQGGRRHGRQGPRGPEPDEGGRLPHRRDGRAAAGPGS